MAYVPAKMAMALIGVATLCLAGCADNRAKEEMTMSSITRSQTTADRAQASAAEALAAANQARMQADAAQRTAQQALDEARAANEKADRMFQRGLRK